MINISALRNTVRGEQGGGQRRRRGRTTHFESLLSEFIVSSHRSLFNSHEQFQSLLRPLSALSFCSWSPPPWIIHSYIKSSFPGRVVIFQQKLNEVAAALGAPSHVLRWGPGQTLHPNTSPPSLTSEMFSSGCSGVKGRLVFHRSPNAYNPPDGGAHKWIPYSVCEAHRGGGAGRLHKTVVV